MNTAGTMNRDRSPNGPASPSFARYFPTFCLIGRGLIAAANRCWLSGGAFAQAVFVLAIACMCVYGAWEQSVGTQRKAALAITKAGGNVYYDWQWQNGGALPPGTKPWRPRVAREDARPRLFRKYRRG